MARVTPPLDIIETDEGVEAILDIPGVQASSVEIVFSRNVLPVTGQKRPSGCEHGDAARLIDGELRVFLPRLAERRGGQIRIPIRS